MKILALHFKNLNSLAGESRVSFTKPAFANTGVFAITGVNGSGKSTILDAITLALYGETSRFDQPEALVITQNADDAYAEIEFKLGDERYQSRWHVHRSHHEGEAHSVDMLLSRLSDGQVLADTQVAVCRAITELTGMDFRNFTRSMLLAQGDFAAFLNALDNERMGILETLVGTDIYADYRTEIQSHADKAQQAIDVVKQELAGLTLLAPEELEAAEYDLQDFQEQLQEYKAEQKHLEEQQLALKNMGGLQLQIVEQKKLIKELQTQLATNEVSLANIATAKQALKFKEDLAELDDKEGVLRQHRGSWESLLNEQQFLREQLDNNPDTAAKAATRSFAEQHQTIDAIKFDINQARLDKQIATASLQSLDAQQAEKKAALAERETWLAEHATDALLLDNFPETAHLKTVRTELADLVEQHKQASNNVKKNATALKDTRTVLAKTIADVAQLKQQLVDEEQTREALLQGYHEDDIERLKNEQQERIRQFQQVLDLAVSYQKTDQPQGGGLFSLLGRKPPMADDPDALAAELAQLGDTIKREENIRRVLEAAISRDALVKRLLPERVHLVDGKPCPLCGAKEHPYLQHPPAIGNSVQALTDQQMKLRDLAVKTDQLNKRIVIAQKNAAKNSATQVQLQGIKDSWRSLCNRLNKASADLDIGDLSVMEQWLKEEQDELKNIITLGKQYQNKTTTIAKLTAEIAKNEGAIGQLHDTAEQLAQDSPGLAHIQLERELALNQGREAEQALAAQVHAQLTALGETMPGKGKEDAFFDRLNSRRQDYQTNQFHYRNLQEELALLASQQAANSTALAEADAAITRLMTSLQGEEQIGVHLALIEKQQLIAEQERLISEQDSQLTAFQQAFQARLQSSPFANLTELRNALQFLAREAEFLKRKADLELQIAAKHQQLEKVTAQLDSDFMLAETAPNPDDIYHQLAQLAEKTDIAQLEVQRLQKRLAQHAENGRRYEQLTGQLHQRQQEAQPALAERSLLDNENGIVFRRRVQIRVADKLLAHTNRILEKISGRYYLRYDTAQPGLALEIEDTFHGNRRRPPKTLSGGESFIVSLALALSLSELANNNKSVDSLFIDEGFGNLDAESLTLVLGTLENLKAYGKTVGVISHVDAVRKRIKTQVQLVKKPNGLGVLKQA
ncbi:MAG: AAA family ATPase [Methylovulum sp.]|nr:AAA family ATPase [Methylovulum sp.]